MLIFVPANNDYRCSLYQPAATGIAGSGFFICNNLFQNLFPIFYAQSLSFHVNAMQLDFTNQYLSFAVFILSDISS